MHNKAVPMGFETRRNNTKKDKRQIIKQSLWDLKLLVLFDFFISSVIIKQSLWDLKRIVYLCERGGYPYNKAVPMGFET